MRRRSRLMPDLRWRNFPYRHREQTGTGTGTGTGAGTGAGTGTGTGAGTRSDSRTTFVELYGTKAKVVRLCTTYMY